MQELIVVLSVLRPLGFLAFLVAFICGIVGHRYATQQNFDVAKIFMLVSAIASVVVLLSNVVFFAVSMDIFSGIMCAIWGYFAWYSWSAYKHYKNL